MEALFRLAVGTEAFSFRKGLAFFLLAGFSLLVAIGLQADPRFAKLYFDSAKTLAASGKFSEAEEILQTALQLEPLYSDALYLKAELLAGKGLRREAATVASEAVKAGTWNRYTPFDGFLLSARLSLDVRRYQDALMALSQAGPRTDREADPLLILVRCRLGLRERGPALTSLKKALELFPDDYRFYELAFRVKGVSPDTGYFLSRRRSEAAYLAALLAYVEQDGPVEEKKDLAEEYYRLGGTSPRASCALMEMGKTDEAELERFLRKGGLSSLDLCRRVSLTLKDKSKDLFSQKLAAFSGTLTIDEDVDGIPEIKMTVLSGLPQELTYDEDQDGIGETILIFRDGSPDKVLFPGDKVLLSIQYSIYPFVEKVEARTPQGDGKAYFPVPEKLALPLIKALPVFQDNAQRILFPYQFDRGYGLFGTEEVKKTAYKIEETGPSSPYLRRYQVWNGKIQKLEEIVQKGREEQVFRRVNFQDEKPVSGERDLDMDGFFDIKEYYSGGILKALEFRNGGSAVYREIFSPERLKEWDLNGDGVLDVKEYRNGPNRVREFSSRLDGIFNEVALDPGKVWRSLAPLDEVMKE